jgi:rhodanese-related sulfurtransferase
MPPIQEQTVIPEVTPTDCTTLTASGAVILDVREPDEWRAGHAPDAQWVPMGEIPSALASLPRDRRIVAICRSGNRSARVTEFLLAQGFDAVNLAGGMKAWAGLGLPVVTDDGVPGAIA